MKKIITTALVLSGVIAYAQTGNVGVNTDKPEATLHLKVASMNANGNNDDYNKTNQGVIIPQLTKQRIADITKANLIDGTMVYANDFADITQTTDTERVRRVSQITTKDFYKYNADRDLWERMSSKRLTKEIKNTDSPYTLSEADYHYYLYVNSTSDVTITVPTDLRDGFTCIVVQEGAGKAIISGAQGANGLKTKAQHSAIGIIVKDSKATVTGDTAN